MITPVNGHLLIEPLKQEQFIASERGLYEEIGTVVSKEEENHHVNVGDKVYFDAWLAVKYPKSDDEFYWLVKWEHVRAIEHA